MHLETAVAIRAEMVSETVVETAVVETAVVETAAVEMDWGRGA